MKHEDLTQPLPGWQVEIGQAEGDGTPFVAITDQESQAGQMVYADKDPLIFRFVESLVRLPRPDLAERQRCAAMLELSNASLLLLAGEMSAQELRTTQAVLGGIRRRMLQGESVFPVPRNRPDKSS